MKKKVKICDMKKRVALTEKRIKVKECFEWKRKRDLFSTEFNI